MTFYILSFINNIKQIDRLFKLQNLNLYIRLKKNSLKSIKL